MIDGNLKIHDAVCTGCSACTEACAFPDENGIKPIALVVNKEGLRVPRINANTCTHCLLCTKACPVANNIFSNDISFEAYREKIGDCYYGYSLDNDHRYEAATAGIATEIAAWMLDTGQADGAVSSYQNSDNVVITGIFTNGRELKEKTRGSIYRQVSMLNGLEKKIKEGNYRRLVLIGLPCHIAGLKQLQKVNSFLRKYVEFFTIALFCKQTKTEAFSRFKRKALSAGINQVIIYRGKGWPGRTRVDGAKSLSFSHPFFNLMWGSFAFTPNYCFACSDFLGTLADISLGDAWLRKYYNDTIGSGLVIVNTNKGSKVVNKVDFVRKIYLKTESVENVIKSQGAFYFKLKIECKKALTMIALKKKKEYSFDSLCNFVLSFIFLEKRIVELLVQKRIIRYFPVSLLKIYLKISGKIKNVLRKIF